MTRRWRIALFIIAGLAAVVWLGQGALKRLAYEEPGRDSWQLPGQVMAALAIEPGQYVADIGAGSGYFTFHFAEAVAGTGRVYAVDIDEEMLEYVARRAATLGAGNIATIIAATDDPRLPAEGVDLIFVGNTYHHLGDRVDYFRRLRSALRPGGRLVIVEFDGRHWMTRWMGHYTTGEQVRSELEEAGYRLAASHHFLPRQSFLVFTAANADAPPPEQTPE